MKDFLESKSIVLGNNDNEKKDIPERKTIENEKKELIKEFRELMDFVDGRYEKSTIAENEKQLKEFKKHNKQVVDLVIEEGFRRNLSVEKIKLLIIGAILHDLCKGDEAPDWAKGIDNFMLVYHGEAAAQEIEKNKELLEIIQRKIGNKDFDENIKNLQRAFRSHMGPGASVNLFKKNSNNDPEIGFMGEQLNRVNVELENRGIEKIEHPLPKEGDFVSEILLGADMYSLASPSGAQKILEIRSLVPAFQKEDQFLCEQYSAFGIDLSLGEAALISAMNSGKSARNMFRKREDRKWLQEAIDKTESSFFEYSLDKNVLLVDAGIVKQKMIKYEESLKEKNIRERIDKAA